MVFWRNSPIPLFSLLPPDQTGITFNNQIIENESINILTYEYFHNGGGVAIGDINNDGLADVYMTGNLAPNKLYLNKGGLRFEDISQTSGTEGTRGWNTGVTMVDINQDGWLDIYICLSGNLPPDLRENQLLVNNQDGTFTEKAAQYGINDAGFATQAVFFDYDLDGDLDLFLLNHNILPINNFKPSETRNTYDPNVGDKLYRNNNDSFEDVSKDAGIYTNPLGYGLGVSVGDLNNDGYPDIYVANDFIEHDYCYFNNGDGTFRDGMKEAFPQTSQFSMGTDMADINNDGWVDIISVDMIAEDNYRQKTTMRPMDRSQFYYAVEDGFHYQYMHNALQLNRGNGHFSNISKLAGVSATDWSWAPLLVDLDLDGWKDLIVSNGYKKDISNKDYVSLEKKKMKAFKEGKISNTEMFRALLDAAPVTKIENYVFRNNGDYTFTKMSREWGFDQKAFSNGMAYGDLDNDGDLDLVINNIDELAYVFQNNTRENNSGNYLRLALTGPARNKQGIGAKIQVTTGETVQVFEQYLTRGFQSSVDPVITVGLGQFDRADEIQVRWHDGKVSLLKNITANQTITITYAAAAPSGDASSTTNQLVEDITDTIRLKAYHRENAFDDFDFEVLLPHKMSQWGPALAVGDVNGDSREDFLVGGASGYPNRLYLQQASGSFLEHRQQDFNRYRGAEALDAAFFDADNDGDLDLYVVNGGNEFEANSPAYADHFFLNDGKGNFTLAPSALPERHFSGSVVRPFDIDEDGDLDVFVGGRMVPRSYPAPADSYILTNENGTFTDATEAVAPALANIGMVTDAVWMDYDGDQDTDLILAGEWMPITVFENKGGQLAPKPETGLSDKVGWWLSLTSVDIDQDGDLDLVAGNLGTNYKYKASPEEPFQVFLNDFDGNGSQDIVLGYFEEGTLFPVRGRQCSSEQMPFIADKFPTYDLFGKADLAEIYGEIPLQKALNYQATSFESAIIKNMGNGTFHIDPLPVEAQMSAIHSTLVRDVNQDGFPDLISAGNLFASEVETPRNDAGVGLIMLGNGKGGFAALPPFDSGLYLPYDIKKMAFIQSAQEGTYFLAAPNNGRIRMLKIK